MSRCIDGPATARTDCLRRGCRERPHEGYWPTECISAKRDNARRRMRPVLDARPDLGRTAEKYAARRSAVAWMGIAVLRWADA